MKSEELKPKKSTKNKYPVKATGKFPVVCIGASAGGLEALEQFLENVTQESGIKHEEQRTEID